MFTTDTTDNFHPGTVFQRDFHGRQIFSLRSAKIKREIVLYAANMLNFCLYIKKIRVIRMKENKQIKRC